MQNLIVTLIAVFLFIGVHTQAAVASPAAQAQQQPCGTAASPAKPNIKLPPALQKGFDRYSPVSGSDLTKVVTGKPAPCPPVASPNTQLAPVLHLPAGVLTMWTCTPVVVASDHTTSYVMPSDITEASPIQAGTFEADLVKADPKAITSCSSLHKDPKTARYWFAQ